MKPCAGTRGHPTTRPIVGMAHLPSSGQCPQRLSADAPDAAWPVQDLAETAVADAGAEGAAAAVADAPRHGASASSPVR